MLRAFYSCNNVVATNSQVSSEISFVLRGAAVNSDGDSGLVDAKSTGALWFSGMAASFPILSSWEIVRRIGRHMMPHLDCYTTLQTVGFEPQYVRLFDLKHNGHRGAGSSLQDRLQLRS